jgi:cation transport ATPase
MHDYPRSRPIEKSESAFAVLSVLSTLAAHSKHPIAVSIVALRTGYHKPSTSITNPGK